MLTPDQIAAIQLEMDQTHRKAQEKLDEEYRLDREALGRVMRYLPSNGTVGHAPPPARNLRRSGRRAGSASERVDGYISDFLRQKGAAGLFTVPLVVKYLTANYPLPSVSRLDALVNKLLKRRVSNGELVMATAGAGRKPNYFRQI